MTRATLEFELPEEKEEFNYASRGVDYYLTLSDLDNWLRNKIKYSENTVPYSEEIYQHIRNILHDLASERGVEI